MNPLFYLHSPFQIQLSFGQVIENLEKTATGPVSEKAAEAQQLLSEVAQHPELKNGITDISQIERSAGLIGRLMVDYFPPELSLNEIKAVSIPFQKFVFNRTERFRNILKAANTDFNLDIRDFDEHQSYVLSCCIILNEFYGTQLDFSKPLFADIPAANGITRHYRILYNADFLDIIPTEKSVKITQEDIDLLLDNYDNLDLWKEKFPKDSWILRGFAIMSLYDATIENAVSTLKEKLLTSNITGFHESIESIFRSIYQSPDIKVGFTLFHPENKTFSIAPFGEPMQSYILPADCQTGEQVLCNGSFDALINKQSYFAVSNTAEFYSKHPDSSLASHFLSQNIQSFILAPVIKNNILLGIFEVVSVKPKELNSVNAHKLEVVMPYLTDTADRLITEFQNQVQAVIQTNYTSIHPSVYWRFRDEAQQYILARQQDHQYALNEVVFHDVHPLYGQTDIKGSSEARNFSIQKDLKKQLQTLLTLMEKLSLQNDQLTFAAEQQKLEDILKLLDFPLQANTEQYINDYLNQELHPQLRKAVSPECYAYFSDTDKQHGKFYHYRRKYETTVSLINRQLTQITDSLQPEAQSIFPHYYERFKTDGVEHNIYAGSSIAPNLSFTIDELHKLRLWQLKSLCQMAQAHNQLKPNLPYPLDVTTLILVYHSTISICFRMDEKRFDIDGTYNARYEVAKKRIDKAHIKGTTDRIVKPGRITIVYSGTAEAAEYHQYIKTLQAQNLLGEKVEQFDIEDLQGVSGLKALRVKVAI